MVLGASSEAPSVIRQFVEAQGITFPILLDSGGSLKRLYPLTNALSPFPRDYIIDQNGVFRYASTEYDPQTMIAVIESLLEADTGVNENAQPKVRDRFELGQTVPNPFNQSARIEFSIPRQDDVTITVHNTSGQQVAQLAQQEYPAGRHVVNWNGQSDQGEALPSGVYFFRIRTTTEVATRKFTILR